MDDKSSVDDKSSSDDDSLSSDDKSGSVDLQSVMVANSSHSQDVSVEFKSVAVAFGQMELEFVDMHSCSEYVLSNGVEVVNSVSVNSNLPVSESSVGSGDDGGSNSDGMSQFHNLSSVS